MGHVLRVPCVRGPMPVAWLGGVGGEMGSEPIDFCTGTITTDGLNLKHLPVHPSCFPTV